MADELKLPTDPDAQRCLKCGSKDALDTGWECTECGYDNMPWYRPHLHRPTCYQCGKTVTWLAPDSRCGDCTRLTPDEVRGQ